MGTLLAVSRHGLTRRPRPIAVVALSKRAGSIMLASPLPISSVFSTTHVSDDSALQYRPARDKEAFNSLLPPPIEFVEGSSSGALAVPLGKYEPINASPKASKPDRPETPKPPTAAPPTATGASAPTPKSKSLHSSVIDITWPDNCNRGSGLYNSGNTCFLNSALQCLLHTPPLLRMLLAHKKQICTVDKGFCMSCSMRAVMVDAHTGTKAFAPTPITTKLHLIAKHLRKGRQEDSHEFLRYAIDAMQKSCLAGHSPKLDPKIAETTWVHKIFGGQLRSRVTCQSCGHNSDTFDRVLDLSVDIHGQEYLRDALKKFVAIDHLKGADKYKCEKCKKHVNAEKSFTIHEAPTVLTVHLKRFSPLGRKIPHGVQYDEDLSLQPFMSEGHFGPTYSLYGVICHAGSGPNSGHYYAYVKSKDGRWWEMNDESVSPHSSAPRKKNAYMLFYIRKKGQGLEAVVNPTTPQPQSSRPGVIGGMKKRKERDEAEEDTGTKVSKPFIGPLLPSPALDTGGSEPKRQKVNGADPQAELVKKKIAKAKASETLTSLTAYALDDEGEKEDEDDRSEVQKTTRGSSPPQQPPSSQPASSQPPSSPAISTSVIPPSTFYNNPNPKKRKNYSADRSDSRMRSPKTRSSGHRGGNLDPFSGVRSTFKRRPRPI
ncbi:hypothetical protein DXG01_006014 [Tephrocybe rancida]|nr:hypothetical protein DXG01_006014 [Tephrocybe rancida]